MAAPWFVELHLAKPPHRAVLVNLALALMIRRIEAGRLGDEVIPERTRLTLVTPPHADGTVSAQAIEVVETPAAIVDAARFAGLVPLR